MDIHSWLYNSHTKLFLFWFLTYTFEVWLVSMCNSSTNAQYILNSFMQLLILAAINLITAIYVLTLLKYRFSSHVWKAVIYTTTVSTNLICHFLSKKSVREWNSYSRLTLDAYLFQYKNSISTLTILMCRIVYFCTLTHLS